MLGPIPPATSSLNESGRIVPIPILPMVFTVGCGVGVGCAISVAVAAISRSEAVSKVVRNVFIRSVGVGKLYWLLLNKRWEGKMPVDLPVPRSRSSVNLPSPDNLESANIH